MPRAKPDTGPIRSLRRDPFEKSAGTPPVVKRSTVKGVATDQSGNQHAPESDKIKKPLVPKRGRQKRRGMTADQKKELEKVLTGDST